MEHQFINKSKTQSNANAEASREENTELKKATSKEDGFKGLQNNASTVNSFIQPVQKKPQDKEGNLKDDVQAKMEYAFETDFSEVKIFENSSTAKDLNALAFTEGNEIHFAPQQDPYSTVGQRILGHELAHVQQQRENRVSSSFQELGFNVNVDSGLESEADAFGSKAAEGQKINNGASKNSDIQRAGSVQKKSGSPIQKFSAVPGGATILNISADFDNLYIACSALASNINAAASNINWQRRIGQQLEGPISANTLPPLNLSFTEDTGINWNWTVSVNWRINNPAAQGPAKDRQVTRNFGGSSQITNGTGTTSQDSASLTVAAGDKKEGTEVGGSIGTQSGTSTTNQQQFTLNGGGSTAGSESMQNYTANLVASITVQGSPDFSGSDYINPFKWGYGAGAAIGAGMQHGDYAAGTLSYRVSV